MKKMNTQQVLNKLKSLDQRLLKHSFWQYNPEHSDNVEWIGANTTGNRIIRRMERIQQQYQLQLVGTEYELLDWDLIDF